MRESVILQSSRPAARSLRAIFEWREDRFGHRIELFDGHKTYVLLDSREGLAEDRWPLSPPLQHLHREERIEAQAVVLLVGMSGKDYWSASVEIDALGESLTFDVACRVATPGLQLSSSYELNVNAQADWKLTPLECDRQSAAIIRAGPIISIVPPNSPAHHPLEISNRGRSCSA